MRKNTTNQVIYNLFGRADAQNLDSATQSQRQWKANFPISKRNTPLLSIPICSTSPPRKQGETETSLEVVSLLTEDDVFLLQIVLGNKLLGIRLRESDAAVRRDYSKSDEKSNQQFHDS